MMRTTIAVVTFSLAVGCSSSPPPERSSTTSNKLVGDIGGGGGDPCDGSLGYCPAECQSCGSGGSGGGGGGDLGGGDPLTDDGQNAMRDYCGNDSWVGGLLDGLCSSGTSRQWSHCYTTGTYDVQGRDVNSRVLADSAACMASGGTYMTGSTTFVYTPASCCQ
jgi:hypothetical protein